jgi:hypothetical protein
MELDQDRMTRLLDVISQNEIVIDRMEEIIRSSVRVAPLQTDVATCTAEDFASPTTTLLSSGDAAAFLTRPDVTLLKLQLTLAKELALQAQEREAFVTAVGRLKDAALALQAAVVGDAPAL